MKEITKVNWLTWRFDGRESGPLTLFPGDLVMHLRPARWGGTPEILDAWEMAEYGELFVTSRHTEFPAGISQEDPKSAPMSITYRMRSGTESVVQTDPPNVWRVRAGDRVALIGERPGLAEKMIYCLADFTHSALVYWRYDEDDLPDPHGGDDGHRRLWRSAQTRMGKASRGEGDEDGRSPRLLLSLVGIVKSFDLRRAVA